MKNKALYYPYINLPKKEWTFKTLLYWDSLLSIVPSSYIYNPEELEPFMLELVKEGLVEQVFPVDHLHKVKNYDEIFLNYIEEKYIKSKRKLSGEYSKIHMEKLNSISNELIKMNLAIEADSYPWVLVEKNVANDFMIYLANTLAGINDAIPVSDKIGNAKLYDKQKSFYANKKHKTIHNTILDAVLPYPDEKLSISEIVRFKENHGELLPEFRKFIDKKSYKLSIIKGREYREEKIKEVIDDIREESLKIQDAMKSRFQKIAFGSILPIFADASSIYGTTTGILAASSGLTTDITISALGTAAGVSGNLYSDLQNNNREEQQPVAYVAHARRSLSPQK